MADLDSPALAVSGLSKIFGSLRAVDDLSFTIERGEIFGLLGPNGAGKTTTILLLLGLIPPTAGQVRLFGEPLGPRQAALRRRVGVVLEQQSVYQEMSAEDYLEFFCRIYGVENPRRRIGETLEMVDLARWRAAVVGGFSRGMRLKLGLARALLHDPDLLILDEPVEGLDPNGIREVRSVLLAHHERGKTILLSSHMLSEVERIADRVAILNQGRLLAVAPIEALRDRLAPERELLLEVADSRPDLPEVLRQLPFVREALLVNGHIRVRVPAGGDHRADLARAVNGAGGLLVSVQSAEVSLEQAFAMITQDNVKVLAEAGSAPAARPAAAPDAGRAAARSERVDRLRVARVVAGRALRSLALAPAPYVMLALTLLATAAVTNSYLSVVARSGVLVLPRPWLLPAVGGTLLLMFYLALSAALALAHERESGTLQVLFFGPVDEAGYVLGILAARGGLYLGWLGLFLAALYGYGWWAGLAHGPALLAVAAYSIGPLLVTVSLGLLAAAATRSVRGAVFTFIGVAGGFAAAQALSRLLAGMAAGRRSFALAYAGQAAEAAAGLLRWLSPAEYLTRGVDAVRSGELALLAGAAALYASILAGAAIWALRRRTVTPR